MGSRDAAILESRTGRRHHTEPRAQRALLLLIPVQGGAAVRLDHWDGTFHHWGDDPPPGGLSIQASKCGFALCYHRSPPADLGAVAPVGTSLRPGPKPFRRR